MSALRKTGGYVSNDTKFVDNYFSNLSKDTRDFIGGDYNVTLSENLNKIAKEKNISMYRIAKDGELSMSYVWDICKGKKENPSLSILRKLSKVLDVSIEELIG